MVLQHRNQRSYYSTDVELSEESGLNVAYGSSPNKFGTCSNSGQSGFNGLTASNYKGRRNNMVNSRVQTILLVLNKFGVTNVIQVLVLAYLLFSNHRKNTKLHVASTELHDMHDELAESLHLLDEFEHDLDVAQQEILRMHKIMITKDDHHDHERDENWLHHEETVDMSNDVIAKHDAQEERINQLQKSIQYIHRNELQRR